jgi:hypothetical protein
VQASIMIGGAERISPQLIASGGRLPLRSASAQA